MGPCVTFKHGMTGVFLDPPYSAEDRTDCYNEESYTVAKDVLAWCEENGDNPLLRIALCGYEGEDHHKLEGLGWSVESWKANDTPLSSYFLYNLKSYEISINFWK